MFRLCSSLAFCLTCAVLQPHVVLGAEPGTGGLARPITVSKLEAEPALEIYPPGTLKARQKPRLESFFAEHSDRWEVRWDTRSDRPHMIQGPGISLWPEKSTPTFSERGAPAEVQLEQVARRARGFLADHPQLFGIAPENLRLDRRRSFAAGDLWLIELEQIHGGLPVIGAGVFLRINHGRLVQFGSQGLAPVELDLEPTLTAGQAFDRALQTLGRKLELLADRGLAILPVAAGDPGKAYLGIPGQGIRHRLGWRLTAGAASEGFDLVVDAHSGELLKARSLTHSLSQASGQVAAVRRDLPLETVPLPWLQVVNGGTRVTDEEGVYSYSGDIASAELSGMYVTVDDACGRSKLDSFDGELDFGTGGGDCQTPGLGGAGNTLAARTAYYYLSRAQANADELLGGVLGPRGDGSLLARTNLPGDGCRAFYNGALSTVDFERSTSGCANPGEIPGIVVHEYGHSLFDTYAGTTDGGSAEAAADTFSFLETGEACIGDSFRPGVPCRNCSPTCTGVRDLAAFALGGDAVLARPDTVTDAQGLACERLGCPYLGAGAEEYQGPMGYQAHCESLIASSANWDLAQRLVQVHGDKHGWRVMNQLWYYSLASTGSAYRRVPGMPQCVATEDAVDGCGLRNWYSLYLSVDDDDGNLANGTPNACLIWQAFDAHGIACGNKPSCFCAQAAVADAGPKRTVCTGEPVEIGAPARPGVSYEWTSDPAPPGPVEGWDQARIVVAPEEATHYTVAATTSCDSALDQVTVHVAQCEVPFDGGFEAGGGAWQASGLWHLTESSACTDPGYVSPYRAMYYGQDLTCDYDTGGQTSGELISPRIDGITANSHLVFASSLAVESAATDRDRAEVAIAVAGSSDWDPRWARDALDDTTGAWQTGGPISLAPYAGQQVQVRFRFDSRDAEANAHPGWLIDEVAVIEMPPAVGSPPEIEVLDPLEGSYPACNCVPVSAYAPDAEDGDLAAIVHWSSDRDGTIGAGRSLAAALSVGTHVLTAQVTDHSGLTTSTSRTVVIEPADGCDLNEWPPAEPGLFGGAGE